MNSENFNQTNTTNQADQTSSRNQVAQANQTNQFDQAVPNNEQEQFNNQTLEQNMDSSPVAQNPTNGKSGLMKTVIAVLVILVISAISVFAYQQFVASKIDPATLLKDSTVASLNRYMEGNFKTDVLINFSQTVLENPDQKMAMEFPMSLSVGKFNEGEIGNTHFQVGNIDLAPLFQTFGAPAEMLQAYNNNLNFEFKTSSDGIYARVNSFPEALKMFMPVPEKFLNEWIYAETESAVNSASMFSGLDIDSYVSVMGDKNVGEEQEKLKYALDRFSNAIFEEADAETKISSSGSSYNIKYQIALPEFVRAMNLAGTDIVNKYPEFEFTPIDENMVGDLKFEININKGDKLISSWNYALNTIIENVDMGLDLSMTNNFDEDVEIEIPESNIKMEELMKELMGPMMIGGLN